MLAVYSTWRVRKLLFCLGITNLAKARAGKKIREFRTILTPLRR
jgi:hypothetical protein